MAFLGSAAGEPGDEDPAAASSWGLRAPLAAWPTASMMASIAPEPEAGDGEFATRSAVASREEVRAPQPVVAPASKKASRAVAAEAALEEPGGVETSTASTPASSWEPEAPEAPIATWPAASRMAFATPEPAATGVGSEPEATGVGSELELGFASRVASRVPLLALVAAASKMASVAAVLAPSGGEIAVGSAAASREAVRVP